MRIAWDTDGIIVDTEWFQFKYGVPYFKKQYIRAREEYGKMLNITDVKDTEVIKNENGYGIEQVFDCDATTEERFWTKNILPYTFLCPTKNGIEKVIKWLHDDGDENYNFTARAKTNEKSIKGALMRILLKVYYILHHIPPFKKTVYFPSKGKINKGEMCKKYGIDIIFEDDPQNIEEILQNSPDTIIFCSTTKNNQSYSNPKVIRYSNADQPEDIYRKIRLIKESKDSFTGLSREERSKLSREQLISHYQEMRKFYIRTACNKQTIRRKELQYKLTYIALKPLFALIQKYKVINKNLIPKDGGLIVVFNHRDYIDTPLAMSILGFRRPTHVMAKAELKKEVVGKILGFMGSIPVDRSNKESCDFAKDEAIRVLLTRKEKRRGGNLIISPEGHRNTEPEKTRLQQFEFGPVSISQRSGHLIVPLAISRCGINGKERLVRVCEPMRVEIGEDLKQANQKLWNTMNKALIENERTIQETEEPTGFQRRRGKLYYK